MKKTTLMFLLIGIIILGVIYMAIQLNQAGPLSQQEVETDTGTPDDEPPQVTSSPDNSISSSNSNSQSTENNNPSSGGEGTTTINSQGQTCSMQQISYSLRKFETNEVCNTQQSQTCIDKTVTCSLEVTNLDYGSSGDFEIVFSFFKVGEEQLILFSDSDSQTVQPRETKGFSGSFQIQGTEADNQFDCKFQSGEIPQKEVCF